LGRWRRLNAWRDQPRCRHDIKAGFGTGHEGWRLLRGAVGSTLFGRRTARGISRSCRGCQEPIEGARSEGDESTSKQQSAGNGGKLEENGRLFHGDDSGVGGSSLVEEEGTFIPISFARPKSDRCGRTADSCLGRPSEVHPHPRGAVEEEPGQGTRSGRQSRGPNILLNASLRNNRNLSCDNTAPAVARCNDGVTAVRLFLPGGCPVLVVRFWPDRPARLRGRRPGRYRTRFPAGAVPRCRC
jgi:hypothetical protein